MEAPFCTFFFSRPSIFLSAHIKTSSPPLGEKQGRLRPGRLYKPTSERVLWRTLSPPSKASAKDFCIIYRPPCCRAAPRSDKAAPLQENGFFLQRISDKEDKRGRMWTRRGVGRRRATEGRHAHPTTDPEPVNFPRTGPCQQSPAPPDPHPPPRPPPPPTRA